MLNSFAQGLAASQKITEKLTQNITVLSTAHWLAKAVLKGEGYRWEVRRNGELKLGYWKKTLRARDSHKSYPKRFVLIPGFGDTPMSWYFVVLILQPILKKNFDEIILFDFPGFGGFLNREKSFPSFDLMTGALNDALDSLKPHTILGHSLGAWLASQYTAQCGMGNRPTSNKLNYSGPDTLMLANPSGIFADPKTREIWETLFRTAMKEGFPILRPHLFAKEPLWFKWIVPGFSKFITREDILQFMESVRDEHGIAPVAHHIQSKVWLIWGENDTLIPASCARAWLDLLAGPQGSHHAVLIRGAGHSPHIERPAVTAAVIAQIVMNRTPHRRGGRWWSVVRGERLAPSF